MPYTDHCLTKMRVPVYLGLPQSGISATVADSIALLPPDLHGLFWANIGLIGGNTKFPGFPQRLCVF